jgi:hypothetical protein
LPGNQSLFVATVATGFYPMISMADSVAMVAIWLPWQPISPDSIGFLAVAIL